LDSSSVQEWAEERRNGPDTPRGAPERNRTRRLFGAADTRTIALVGHRGSGKTSLAEMLIQAGGVTRTVGRVKGGTALLDHTASERRRSMSLFPSFAWFEWGDAFFNVIDTPGSEVVAQDRRLAALAADTVVVVLDAFAGVELGAEQALADAAALGLPRFAVVTKLDRNLDLDPTLAGLSQINGLQPVVLQIPVRGDDGALAGVVSLLDGLYHPAGSDELAAPPPLPVPMSLQARVDAAFELLTETIAVADDALLLAYLDCVGTDGDGAGVRTSLPRALVIEALQRAVRAGKLCPVLLAACHPLVGVRPLLDALAQLAPSSCDRAAFPAWQLDGTQVDIRADGAFVAQWVSTQIDEEGAPYYILRVWSGTPPRSGTWTNGTTGDVARIRKLYQIRGPRRAVAMMTGAGAILATWEPLPGTPGDAFTAGERWVLRAPEVPAPMIAWWVGPRPRPQETCSARAAEHRRFEEAVARIVSMDPSLWVDPVAVDGGLVVHAACEGQLAWLVDRAAEWFQVELVQRPAPVPYRETPIVTATDVQGRHRVEDDTGLVKEFAEVRIDLVSSGSDEVEIENYLSANDVPPKFHEAILEGVRKGLAQGPLGYPVVGATVRLVGGDFDILESTEDHFRLAGELAVRRALDGAPPASHPPTPLPAPQRKPVSAAPEARPTDAWNTARTRLLEPWVEVVVWAGPSQSGEVFSELASRRSRIVGLEVAGEDAAIHASVPYRELRTFAPRLQAITGGRGRFVSGEWHWEPLPANIAP
jgi:elongation factor G